MSPAPCDPKVFQGGKPVMLVDTNVGADNFEEWVQELARRVNAPTDWHYSGGVAQVLTLGDPELVGLAAEELWAASPPESERGPMRILKMCYGRGGAYRQGVTETPPGALGGYIDPVTGEQVYIVPGKVS